MTTRKEMLERVVTLTGAKEEDINKIYSALLDVILDDMYGCGYEDTLFRGIYDTTLEPTETE